MKFGELELFVVSDGTFRLDGGAMFGTIPKVLWERTNPADDRNRILMGLKLPVDSDVHGEHSGRYRSRQCLR